MAKWRADVDKIKEIVRRLDCAKDILFHGGASIPPGGGRISKEDYWAVLDAAEDQVIAAADLLSKEIDAVRGIIPGKRTTTKNH